MANMKDIEPLSHTCTTVSDCCDASGQGVKSDSHCTSSSQHHHDDDDHDDHRHDTRHDNVHGDCDQQHQAHCENVSVVGDQAYANNRAKLEQLLDLLDISYETVDHPKVYTVDQMLPHLQGMSAAVSKNLFLKDKKKNLYLVSCCHDAEIKLADLGKQIKASGSLRLTDESTLQQVLDVEQGSVTAFALMNDTEHKVKFICDARLIDGTHKSVAFHPMVNSSTLVLAYTDFVKFLKHTLHEPVVVNLID